MNILVTYKESDVAFYTMLGELSKEEGFNIYIAVDSKERLKGMNVQRCISLLIPTISSKFTSSAIRALRHIIKTKEIDVIFSPSSSGLSNALFASLGTKAKNMAYRGTQAKVKRMDPTYYLGILNPRIAHVICETEDIKTYLSSYIKKNKLTVAVKPYEVEWVADACAHPHVVPEIPADAFRCVYIGTTKNRPFKGLSYLIEALNLLNDPSVHLTFVGDYDQKDYDLAKNGPVGDSIHFLGGRPDAIHFLPNQDLFILPATRDASPRVVREAMACGVPCIVTDIPGARDLIEDGKSGLLVPSRDPQQIADAIKKLMDDRALLKQLAENSRQRILSDFSLHGYVETFKKVFNSFRSL